MWVTLITHSRIILNQWYVPCSLYQTCLVHDNACHHPVIAIVSGHMSPCHCCHHAIIAVHINSLVDILPGIDDGPAEGAVMVGLTWLLTRVFCSWL